LDVWHVLGRLKMHSLFWSKYLKGRGHLRDLSENERKMMKQIFKETGIKGVDWLHLAQDRDKKQAVVNVIMKLWVP